jgi:hypothetical protein
MSEVVAAVRSNLPRLVRRWDRETKEDLRRYIGRWPLARPHAGQKRGPNSPIWLLLPELLANDYQLTNRRRNPERRFLSDVLWGQLSAFLALKIQDDLFDGQLDGRSFLWIANEFLLDSRRAFQPHFGTSIRFWDFYDRAISTTCGAILRVDRNQSDRAPKFRSIAQWYPSMYEVCKIATWAVCLKAGRLGSFQNASRFLDELTLTGQLIDDLEDIGEDLHRGRVNAAAAFLISGSRSKRKLGAKGDAATILRRDALLRFFRLLHRHVNRAQKIMRPRRHPQLARFLASYEKSLQTFEEVFIRSM